MPDLQLSLDGALAELARTNALQRVDDHADPDWRNVAYQCVVAVARRCAAFTTDEVLDELAKHPAISTHEGRALGPVMMRAQRAGVIVITDRFVKSEAVSRHCASKRVWSSLIVHQSFD
jgi:hypothetical protein